MSKVTFSGEDKLIIINSGITSIDVKTNIYSDWKEWVASAGDFSGSTSDNSRFLQAISAIGGDPISLVLNLGTTFFLENGWKLRPYEGNHSLLVTGNLYSRDGSSPFVPTLGNYNVVINLQTSNLVDAVNVATASAIAREVWITNTESSEYSGGTSGRVLQDTKAIAGDNQALILAGM